MPLLRFECDDEALSLDARRLILAGYTGRKQDQVQKHVDELIHAGVSAPREIPTKYIVPAALVTTNDIITVGSRTTSGEVEYVVYFDDSEEMYIGVGSDHTDREIEKRDIETSKAVCPKPVSMKIWRYSNVRDHWDDLVISALAMDGNRLVTYQSSTLDSLMTPEELLAFLNIEKSGTIVFGGTVPLATGLVYSSRFLIRLSDPKTNRILEHDYSVFSRS